MKNITLRQLRYVEALAQTGHFGRAAAACAISQPALSMQIGQLEQSLGARLFERSARAVRLTDFGEQVVSRAQSILRAVDELGDLARASRERLAGRLRIGVIPTVAPYLLPTLLGRLAVSHAGLDIHVRETMTPRLLQELGDGRIDTAILALPVSEPAFTEHALFDEPFFLVRPRADAGRPVPGPEALAGMRLLLLEEGHCFRDQALAFCRMPSVLPRDGLEGSSLSTLVQMVGAGIGVTLIPHMAVAVEARSAPVDIAPLASPAPTRTIGMVWRRTSPLGGQLARIADMVGQAGTALLAQTASPTRP